MLNKKRKKLLAFSLVELSITMLVIGVLIVAIASGSSMFYQSKISSAQSLTKSSPVLSTEGLMVWLEPTLDESFSSAETIDGNTVSRWNDINPYSRTKNNAVQNTVANRPIYIKKGINSLPVIRFDGAATDSDCLVMPDLNINVQTLPAMTLFMIYKVVSAPTQNARGFFGDDNGGNWHRLFIINGMSVAANGGVSNGTTNFQEVPLISTVNKPQLISYISQDTVASGSYFALDRWLATYTFTENHSSAAAHTNGTAIGAIDSTCRNAGNVDIGEFIVFDRVLKESEIRAIEDYLVKKWNITLTSGLF